MLVNTDKVIKVVFYPVHDCAVVWLDHELDSFQCPIEEARKLEGK